jgi:hypothetical protein
MPKLTFLDPPQPDDACTVDDMVFGELQVFTDWAQRVLNSRGDDYQDPAKIWAQAQVFANNLKDIAQTAKVDRAWRARAYRNPDMRKAEYAE